jgi:hypothetical protein
MKHIQIICEQSTELLKVTADARFEVITAKVQVEVFWFETPYSVVVGYQHFGGPCKVDLEIKLMQMVHRAYSC